LKRGSIASISDNYRTLIIDCPVYKGNSGGPVFLERKSFEKYSLKLIGIVIELIPFFNQTASKKDVAIQNSNYAVVTPIDYALKLMNNK
jgi:V8-like Glu-specific endopeptidase